MFIHWFLRCQCLLLSCLTCLTMSNLLWFMDLTFQVPRQYYSYSVGLYFHHQTPPQTEHHFDQAFSFFLAAAAAKSHQSCLTLCDPIDGSPPDSPIPGILQARIPEWVAIPFSRGSSQLRDRTQVSRITGRHFTVWATREATIFT